MLAERATQKEAAEDGTMGGRTRPIEEASRSLAAPTLSRSVRKVVEMARRFGLLAVLVLVVAALFWSGVHNLRKRRMQMQQAQQAQVTITKDGPDAAPSAGKLEGKAAPGFTLLDTSGKKVSLADYKGKPVVVNFWATWCGPCRLEMPWFEEFSAKYKDQGLVVLGISEDDGAPKEDIDKAVRKAGVSYPILLTDGKVSGAYGGVDYLPETFYVDKTGTVVEETAGAPTKDEMEANIRKLVAATGGL